MWRIETAEGAVERLKQFRGRGARHCLSITITKPRRPLDTVISRVMRIPADAYKVVTTARKPSDNVRVLFRRQGPAQAPPGGPRDGRIGPFPTRVLSPVFRRRLHVRRRAHVLRRHRRRTV